MESVDEELKELENILEGKDEDMKPAVESAQPEMEQSDDTSSAEPEDCAGPSTSKKESVMDNMDLYGLQIASLYPQERRVSSRLAMKAGSSYFGMDEEQEVEESDETETDSAELDTPGPSTSKKKPVMSKMNLFGLQVASLYPQEQRVSSRLAMKEGTSYCGMEDNEEKKRKSRTEIEESEEFHERKTGTTERKTTYQPLPVTAITEEYIRNVRYYKDSKIYCSATGTSCHQCRKKTIDSKTICKSGHCFGVRGQFCGGCLLTRYGENAEDALRDPTWCCPPCRKICNCSICRRRRGNAPTGVMVPKVQEEGHKSVLDYLQKKNKNKAEDDEDVTESTETEDCSDNSEESGAAKYQAQHVKNVTEYTEAEDYTKRLRELYKKNEEAQRVKHVTGDMETEDHTNRLRELYKNREQAQHVTGDIESEDYTERLRELYKRKGRQAQRVGRGTEDTGSGEVSSTTEETEGDDMTFQDSTSSSGQ